MKKIAILLTAALLCGLLCGCMPRSLKFVENAVEDVMEKAIGYPEEETYTAGSFSYNAAEVRRVRVSWLSANVTLKTGEGETLYAAETGELSEAQQMHWRMQDGTLTVMFCASGYVGTFPAGSKRLTLEVPAGVDLEVTTVSAGISCDIPELGEVKLSTTSGSLRTGDLTAEELKLQSVSGSIYLNGKVQAAEIGLYNTSGAVKAETLSCTEVDVGTVSGSVHLGLSACTEADVETVSGDVCIGIAKELGAEIKYGTVSGKLKCADYRVTDGKCIYGNGGCEVSVSTVSGSLTVAETLD